jgi:hypothetical protein
VWCGVPYCLLCLVAIIVFIVAYTDGDLLPRRKSLEMPFFSLNCRGGRVIRLSSMYICESIDIVWHSIQEQDSR